MATIFHNQTKMSQKGSTFGSKHTFKAEEVGAFVDYEIQIDNGVSNGYAAVVKRNGVIIFNDR